MEHFSSLKFTVKTHYDSISSVYCPYFKEHIQFKPKGFKHLLYKGSINLRKRTSIEQKIRLKLFPLAPNLLSITNTVQDFEERISLSRGENLKYWGFAAIIAGQKVKVVVREKNEKQKEFWSVIPNWRKGERFLFKNASADSLKAERSFTPQMQKQA